VKHTDKRSSLKRLSSTFARESPMMSRSVLSRGSSAWIASRFETSFCERRGAMYPNALRFVVVGEPVGKMRARTFVRMRRDGKPFATTTTPDKQPEPAILSVQKVRWGQPFAVELKYEGGFFYPWTLA